MHKRLHPPLARSYDAFLFDMDGTLISSIAAAERVWSAWARRHGLDVDAFLPTIHGVRARDTIAAQGLAGIDLDEETAWITRGEIDDVDGVVAIGGVIAFLQNLPADRWAIVTSATLDLAERRLAAAGVVPPAVVVTAGDIENGKPNPDGFLLAARKLGVDPAHCLVFEDAPAGIAAGEAAGADVVVITATHQHPFETRHLAIADYHAVAATVGDDGRISLSLSAD